MIKLDVCKEDRCHLKGSKYVLEIFEKLILERGLSDKVDLNPALCMGNCVAGVSVSVNDGEVFSVTPENAEEFFEKEIMTRL